MAQLRNLGMPFGSPGGIINIPAPAGSQLAGQIQMQSMQGIGQALGQYLGQKRQQERWQQDLRNYQVAQQSAGATGLGQIPSWGMPQMQSRMGQQAQTQSQLGQMFPAPADPFSLTPGAGQYTGTGELIAEREAEPKTTQASSVITDPNNPDRAIRVRDTFNEQGNLINRQVLGEATLAEKIGGVAAEGLQRGTKTKLENDIIELQGTLAELEAIDKQFDEDFFTYRGRAKTYFTALAEKLEIPVSQAQREFLKRKTKFFADSKRVFLKFRKFITGVAGGIEEFREIAKATIDPEEDSSTQFKSKFDSMRDNAIRTQNVLLAIRNSGLDPNNKAIQRQVFRGLNLKNIPLDVPGTVTLDTLTKGAKPKELLITPFQTGATPTATDPRTGKRWILKNNEWIERK